VPFPGLGHAHMAQVHQSLWSHAWSWWSHGWRAKAASSYLQPWPAMLFVHPPGHEMGRAVKRMQRTERVQIQHAFALFSLAQEEKCMQKCSQERCMVHSGRWLREVLTAQYSSFLFSGRRLWLL
jgi:hypothetical protein